MLDKQPLPLGVKVIAWLFILAGAASLVDALLALADGELNILNTGLVLPFVGYGLLRQKRLARTAALVFAWLYAAMALLLTALVVFGVAGHTSAEFFGRTVAPYSTAGILIIAAGLAVALGLSVWTIRVLRRADVREQFAA